MSPRAGKEVEGLMEGIYSQVKYGGKRGKRGDKSDEMKNGFGNPRGKVKRGLFAESWWDKNGKKTCRERLGRRSMFGDREEE